LTGNLTISKFWDSSSFLMLFYLNENHYTSTKFLVEPNLVSVWLSNMKYVELWIDFKSTLGDL